MKKYIMLVAVLIAAAVSTTAIASVPSVDISGVIGGAHWLWLEAEDADSFNGIAAAAQSYAISGYRDAVPFLTNIIYQGDGGQTLIWNTRIPAALSNPTILAYCGSHFERSATVSIDGLQVGAFDKLPLGAWGAITGWAAASLTTISAGNHSLQIQLPYDSCGFDGVLLYDGNISTGGHPTIQAEFFGGVASYWIAADMLPNGRPVISSGSVTPSFNVTGAADARYFVNKDGVVSAYVPGTAITVPGVYRVWVEAWGSVDNTTPQERTIAGVDFILGSGNVLPSVEINGLGGASHWIWVEAEDANTISQGNPGFWYRDYLSGFKGDDPYLNNVVTMSWNTGAPDIKWILPIPAAMNNPKIVAQIASHYGRGMNILLDGISAGSFSSLTQSDYGFIGSDSWSSVALNQSISSGNHVLELAATAYELFGIDGILLYDGNIDASGHPTTSAVSYDGIYSVSWMNANMQPVSVPVINAPSLTPEFTVNGIDDGGVNYFVSIDGIVTPYIPGTELNQPGRYTIWAEAWGDTAANLPDASVPQKRILAGADFILSNDNRPRPSVEIQGLDGAAHWIWMEAEYAETIQNGMTNIKDIEDYSGYRAIEPRIKDQVYLDAGTGTPSIQWKFYAPGNIGGNYTILAHCGQHYLDRGMNLIIDGNTVSQVQCPQSDWGDIPLWVAWPVAAPIATGTHTLTLQGTIYNTFGFDGLLIYGGILDANQNPSVVNYPDDMKWMEANMSVTNFPVIAASSVIPVFNVTGTEQGGVVYWISKDGAAKNVYVPGTPIAGSGQYRVWAEAWESQWNIVPTIPQKRILAGADFELQAPSITTIEDAKQAADGTSVGISDAIVTASFDGYIYIQADQNTGIRVDKQGLDITLPAMVSVSGTVETNDDGERYINATIVNSSYSNTVVEPLALNNKSLGGGDFFYSSFPVRTGQAGVFGGTGLNNIGLLVKVWGQVTPVNSTTFKITDGSGVDVYVESLMGGIPSGTPNVAVTGASSCVVIEGNIQRMIRVDDPTKIQVL